MATEIKLWKINDGKILKRIPSFKLKLEEQIELWLEADISILSSDLLVIGRQVETKYGGVIDLLCLNHEGDTVIIELKRGKTPRQITAQILDYASWVKNLSNDEITNIANHYLNHEENDLLETAFNQKFSTDLPDVLNESHSMIVVGAEIDSATERIVQYLSETYGVDINAATFQLFKNDNQEEYLARTFLIEPTQVESNSQTRSTSKRKPNLTLTALQEIADEKGVGALYEDMLSGIEKHLIKTTTRSSLSLYANSNGRRRSIFSLLPSDSNEEQGLQFTIYIHRFVKYFGTSIATAKSILPKPLEAWEYYPKADKEWTGYTGYFQTSEDIQTFLLGVESLQN